MKKERRKVHVQINNETLGLRIITSIILLDLETFLSEVVSLSFYLRLQQIDKKLVFCTQIFHGGLRLIT